jgi:hypothetical protein
MKLPSGTPKVPGKGLKVLSIALTLAKLLVDRKIGKATPEPPKRV